MKTYKLTQTETHTYKGESPEEILELFNEGVLDCADAITVTVEEITKNFSGAVSQLETSKSKIAICLDCGQDKNEGGWHAGDNPGITFAGLKQAQNESIIAGIKFAMDYLEDINAHHSANAVAELLDIINGTETAPQWQSAFFAKPEHSLYSPTCEN